LPVEAVIRLNRFYSNITVHGRQSRDVVSWLNDRGNITYVTPTFRAGTVVFHSDLATQEALASMISRHFMSPALLVMGFAGSILMYHLYEAGERTDAYVSSPHEELELDVPAPPGDAMRLCAAFEMQHQVRRVAQILARPASPAHAYALASNRHGELWQALGLPSFSAGASFQLIEIGELPAGAGLVASQLIRTGGGNC
jgi:hypothetical protein